LGVLPSPLASIPGDTVPGNTHLSLTRPASQTGQATPGLLVPSTSETAISFTPPQGASVPHPDISQNDGIFDTHHNSRVPQISNNVEVLQQSHQLARATPDIAADLSRHPLDTAPSSRDIYRPE
jgi:hypothetical protein